MEEGWGGGGWGEIYDQDTKPRKNAVILTREERA